METISVADAKSKFSELISRAGAGERFLISTPERPLAVLMSAAEAERLERAAHALRERALALGQSPDIMDAIDRGELHPAAAAFGLWRDEDDMADLTERIYAEREADQDRPGVDL